MAEAFAAACGVNVVASFCWESILKPVGRQFGYVLCYESYVKDLEEGVGKLDKARDSAQQMLYPIVRSGEEKTTETIEWETKAKGLSEDAKKFLTADQGQVKWTRCSRSNPVWRYWNGRKAYKMAQSARGHAAQVASKTYEPVLRNIVNLKDYIAFDTRGPLVTRILETLGSKEGGQTIGVYGLPGVGKTTLVKAVTKQALDDGLFRDFVEVAVSQSPNLEKIQQDIGDRLGLKEAFKAQGFGERALTLRVRLKKEEKFLIVLDDVWNQLNLDDIGIAFEHPGCKILLTSRSEDVLQKEMNVHVKNTFKVAVLSEEEAWTCFSNIAGAENPHLAEQITKECARLPLAIVTVAGALKCKPLDTWKDALRLLQSSSVNKGIYSNIRLSYDFLKIGESDEDEGDQAQKIFLLCSLHEEDVNISIRDLSNLVIGLGLFRKVYSLESATSRLRTLLGKLKSHGLLLNGIDDESVMMHDVIRDFGISIASKEPNKMFYIRSNDELEECLDNDELKDASAISLGGDYEGEVCLKCPKLRLLWILRRRFGLEGKQSGVADNFFEDTKELRVLSLPRMCLEPLPQSLGHLVKLRALHLVKAKLGNIDLIGDLKKLKVLDFRGSNLKELPEKIGQLTCLKMLNLSRCHYLKVIQPNVISRLVNLEELNMEDCRSYNWKVPGVFAGQENKVSLDEIKGLTKLSGLHLEVQNSNMLPRDFFSTKLTRFNIALGSMDGTTRHHTASRRSGLLMYQFDISSLRRDHGFNTLLKKSDDLLIRDIAGLENHGFELDKHGFELERGKTFGNGNHNISPNLKMLEVSDMSNLEYICFGGGAESLGRSQGAMAESCDTLKRGGGADHSELAVDQYCIEFPQLKHIRLTYLPKLIGFWSDDDKELSPTIHSARILFNQKVAFPNLEYLDLESLTVEGIGWDPELPEMSSCNNKLQKLRTLEVTGCYRLKYLFSFPIARSLRQLETLEVRNCRALNVIMLPPLVTQVLDDRIEFSKLKRMRLERLPNERIRFYPECDQDQESSVDSATPFFIAKVVFPSLVTLELRELGCERIWAYQLPAGTSYSFQNLIHLRIEGCHRLKYALSFAIAASLVQLVILTVRDCREMKEILVVPEKTLLPKLKNVWLASLPMLSRFCSTEILLCCPNVKQLHIDDCPSWPIIFKGGDHHQDISSDNKKAVCQLEISTVIYQHLPSYITSLIVTGVKSENLLSTSVAAAFVHLATLQVAGCKFMKAVIVTENSRQGFCLPALKDIYLGDLPKLKSFCTGDHIQCEEAEEINLESEQPIFHGQKVAFPSLETLELRDLNMKEIWGDEKLPEISSSCNNKLQKLKKLEVTRCHRLKYLFSLTLARSLKQLETLTVKACMAMGEIIRPPLAAQVLDHRIEFSELKHMHFEDLSNKFTRFYSERDQGQESSIYQKIKGQGSSGDSATPFFNAKVAFPSLEALELRNLFLKAIWGDEKLPEISSSCNHKLQNLRVLTVDSCPRLKYVFSFPTARSLKQLEILNVKDCMAMEEIILPPLAAQVLDHSIEFSKLKHMHLISLPDKFIRFYSECDQGQGSSGDFATPFFNAKVAFPILDTLELSDLGCERIWADQLPVGTSYSFQNLRTLEIVQCRRLKYALSFAIAESLVQLAELKVRDCREMERMLAVGINANKKPVEAGDALQLVPKKKLLPKLKRVSLEGLPKEEFTNLQREAATEEGSDIGDPVGPFLQYIYQYYHTTLHGDQPQNKKN